MSNVEQQHSVLENRQPEKNGDESTVERALQSIAV
jgi:hypothetical protein